MGSARVRIVMVLLLIAITACTQKGSGGFVLEPEARTGAGNTATSATETDPTVLGLVLTQTTNTEAGATASSADTQPTGSSPGTSPITAVPPTSAPVETADPPTRTAPAATTSTAPAATTTTAGSTTTLPASTTTLPVSTTTSLAPPPPIEGPEAPDFTLALAGGGVFTLSDETRPVLLWFWADW